MKKPQQPINEAVFIAPPIPHNADPLTLGIFIAGYTLMGILSAPVLGVMSVIAFDAMKQKVKDIATKLKYDDAKVAKAIDEFKAAYEKLDKNGKGHVTRSLKKIKEQQDRGDKLAVMNTINSIKNMIERKTDIEESDGYSIPLYKTITPMKETQEMEEPTKEEITKIIEMVSKRIMGIRESLYTYATDWRTIREYLEKHGADGLDILVEMCKDLNKKKGDNKSLREIVGVNEEEKDDPPFVPDKKKSTPWTSSKRKAKSLARASMKKMKHSQWYEPDDVYPDKKVTKEEVEEITELSKKKLGDYVKAANKDAADSSADAGRHQMALVHHSDKERYDFIALKHHRTSDRQHHSSVMASRAQARAAKRAKGISTAVGKLTKENTIDESKESYSHGLLSVSKDKKNVHVSYSGNMGAKESDVEKQFDNTHGQGSFKKIKPHSQYHKDKYNTHNDPSSSYVLVIPRNKFDTHVGAPKKTGPDFSKIKEDVNPDELMEDKFDPVELEKGIKREMEHTDSKEVAAKIAKDHLRERPDYYKKIDKCLPEETSLDEGNYTTPRDNYDKLERDLVDKVKTSTSTSERLKHEEKLRLYRRENNKYKKEVEKSRSIKNMDAVGKKIAITKFRAKEKDMNEEVLEESPTRKHFQMVADLIKGHESQDKRNELAKHHADIFKKQNPRFDKKRFHAAAGSTHPDQDLKEENIITKSERAASKIRELLKR